MNTNTFSDAMGEINEKYINEVFNFKKRSRKSYWIKWGAVAACLCLVLAGILPLFNQSGGSPFMLTAYALENDSSLSAVSMKEGENIPVSLFEANNGLWGFVFSHAADDPEQPISVSIVNADQQFTVNEKIETISGLKMDGTQKYVFFIPPQNETGPYSLPLTMHDKKTDSVALLTVVIEQTEDGYTARIDELTTYERKEAQ